MKKCSLLGMLSFCLVMFMAVNASANLLVYEGCDIEGLNAGSQVTGLAGATSFGWAEPFRFSTSAGAAESARFVSDSVAIDGINLKTRGGSLEQTVNNSRVYRNFSQSLGSVDGTYYVSFFFSGGQNIAVDFSNGDWNSNVKASLGTGDSTTGGITLKVGSTSSSVLAPRSELHFYVLKFELASGAGTVSIYVDPDPTQPEPAVPAASITTTEFSADRIRFGKYNSNANSKLDEFRLGTTYEDVTPTNGAASNVSPLDGEMGVAASSLLQWNVGDDPNEFADVQPWAAVAGYYVYVGSGTDPNLYLQTPTALPTATTSYDAGLVKDQAYFWQIEETFDNGLGGVYGPGDPNNVLSSVWSFETELTVPVITQQPAALTRADEGAVVELSVVVDSATTPHYAWYYSADNVVGDDAAVGTDSKTLTLANVQTVDQGTYYCVVSNNGSATATSNMGQLVVNRLLAWYQFENNLDDAAGTNDAAPMGMPMAYTDGTIATDGQAYAADPNGSMYGILPTGCYPKAGFGNGLERCTYSAWVKLADSSEGGNLIGEFNAGYTTSMRFSLNTSGFAVSTYMRDDTNNLKLVADVGGLTITDNEWHFVAITYNGSKAVTYFDGLAVQTVATTISNFADWDYPFPLLSVNSRGTIDGGFKGRVDDLKIYNYALSAEAMAQQYYDVTGQKVCLYGNPTYDFSGDCVVDIADLAIFAADWLTNGFYPAD